MNINVDIEKVFSREEIDRLAAKSGFVARKSAITGFNFLLMLTTGLVNSPESTLAQLAGFLNNLCNIGVSPQAIDGRINAHAKEFLRECLAKAMRISMQRIEIDNELIKGLANIYIIDSTNFDLHPSLKDVFKGNGGSASVSSMRIQFMYDFLTGKMVIIMGDTLTTDAPTLFDLIKTDQLKTEGQSLFLQDLGYFKTETFKAIDDSQCFFVSKLKFKLKIQDLTGRFIDLPKLIKGQPDLVDQPIKIGNLTCRLIGCKLPENIINQRRRKANESSGKKRGKTISVKYKLFLSYNFFITNLPNKYTIQTIFTLYRIRWQVELVFKSWKSVLKIHKIRSAKSDRVYCEIYGKLIMAIIIQRLHSCLMVDQQKVLSLYKTFQYLKANAIKWAINILSGDMKHRKFLSNIAKQICRFCQKTKQNNKPIIEDLLCALSPCAALA